jgi:glycosyltransferase involved in cell wall biosynthesis
VTGILTPPGDVCALADVLNVVKVDELAAMGVRARERFLARFLIDKCEHALANLYGEVVSREN